MQQPHKIHVQSWMHIHLLFFSIWQPEETLHRCLGHWQINWQPRPYFWKEHCDSQNGPMCPTGHPLAWQKKMANTDTGFLRM